jgi:iron complex transport system substrate-binding protein
MHRSAPRFFLLALFFAACQKPAAQPPVSSAPRATNAAEFPLVLTDSLQRTVTLQHVPRRIVSLAPKNTELLFAIGAGPQLVGVTTYCNHPTTAATLPKIGGFSAHSISLEAIVGLQPDLVVSAGELQGRVIAELERLGLPTLALAGDTLPSLREEISLLGQVTGHEEQAAELARGLQDRIERIRQLAAKIQPEQRISVYYQVSDEPVIAAGPTSYIGQAIELCGGTNVISDTSAQFPKISPEVVLARDPDLILAPFHMTEGMLTVDPRTRPEWRQLRAITERRLHWIDGDKAARCGPRFVDAVEQMAHVMYPDIFPAPAHPLPPTAQEPISK